LDPFWQPIEQEPSMGGELVLQTVAMPADSNVYGDVFGGWLVSQMDLGGAILAHKRAKNRVTTVAIDKMTFIKPVYVGDLVCCFAHVVKTGRSSIVIQMTVWAIRMRIHEIHGGSSAASMIRAIHGAHPFGACLRHVENCIPAVFWRLSPQINIPGPMPLTSHWFDK
jgi:acyl-CoA hydrolase